MNLKRHWSYLKYVLKHKYYVFLAGRELKVPLLILLLHDWDKFLPSEWFGYARYIYDEYGARYYRQSKDFRYLPTTSPEFDHAYFLHMKRNKHHWQWWIVAHEGGLHIEPMPDVYIREMLADWVGAGRALGFPDTKDWYAKNKDGMQLHHATRIKVEELIENQSISVKKG